MPYKDYSYSLATDLKNFPFSGGRIAFDDTTTSAQLVTLFNSLDDLLVPGVKSQLSEKVKWFFDRSLPSTLKDMVICRVRLQNKTDKNVDIQMTIPYVLPVLSGDPLEYSPKLTRNALETWVEALIAKKPALRMKDGSYVDINAYRVYVPSSISSSRAADVTQGDSVAVGDTP